MLLFKKLSSDIWFKNAYEKHIQKPFKNWSFITSLLGSPNIGLLKINYAF